MGAGMQDCPNCGHHNRPGVVFCENCGASLIGDSPRSTKQYKEQQAAGGSSSAIGNAMKAAGSDIFSQGTVLRIEIGDAEPILLKPKLETVFGRRDAATGSMPDVDLTPFAGYRMGVSRKHAIVKQSEEADRLELIDLGSSNGSFLNGARLNANKPYKLRDGDEVRLGQMIIHVYFQHGLPEQSSTVEISKASVMPPASPPTSPASPTMPEGAKPGQTAPLPGPSDNTFDPRTPAAGSKRDSTDGSAVAGNPPEEGGKTNPVNPPEPPKKP